jgi:leucyl aminopeptidase (aminopeptidase T)
MAVAQASDNFWMPCTAENAAELAEFAIGVGDINAHQEYVGNMLNRC